MLHELSCFRAHCVSLDETPHSDILTPYLKASPAPFLLAAPNITPLWFSLRVLLTNLELLSFFRVLSTPCNLRFNHNLGVSAFPVIRHVLAWNLYELRHVLVRDYHVLRRLPPSRAHRFHVLLILIILAPRAARSRVEDVSYVFPSYYELLLLDMFSILHPNAWLSQFLVCHQATGRDSCPQHDSIHRNTQLQILPS